MKLLEEKNIIDEELLFAYAQIYRFLTKKEDTYKERNFDFYLKEATVGYYNYANSLYDQLIDGDIAELKVSLGGQITTLKEIQEQSWDDFKIYQDIAIPFQINQNKKILLKLEDTLRDYLDKFISDEILLSYKNKLPFDSQIQHLKSELNKQNLLNRYVSQFIYRHTHKTFNDDDYFPVHTILSLEKMGKIKLHKMYSENKNDNEYCIYFHIEVLNKDIFSKKEDGYYEFKTNKKENGYYFEIEGYTPVFYGKRKRMEIKLLEKFKDTNSRFTKEELGYGRDQDKNPFSGVLRRINNGISNKNTGLKQIGFMLRSNSNGGKFTYSIQKKRSH